MIIEGYVPPVTEEEYLELKREYTGYELSVADIRKKYGLSQSNWKHIRERIYEEEGFIRDNRKSAKKSNRRFGVKNYCKTKKDKWGVYHYEGTRLIWYGENYESEEMAQKMVEELRKVNWDKSQVPVIKERLGCPLDVPQYCYYDVQRDMWNIYKYIEGVYTYFGGYDTKEDAKAMIKALHDNGWNKKRLWIIKREVLGYG